MALISVQISESNYEQILDAICSLLALELAGQTSTEDVNVWKERSIPFDSTELPAVNVRLDGATYDNHDSRSRRGRNTFYIDVHANAKTTDDDSGDTLAAQVVHTIARVIMYVLSSAEYYSLGFTTNIISSRRVMNYEVVHMNAQDALHTVIGRITFEVVSGEYVGSTEVSLIEEIQTQTEINDTDKGQLVIVT